MVFLNNNVWCNCTKLESVHGDCIADFVHSIANCTQHFHSIALFVLKYCSQHMVIQCMCGHHNTIDCKQTLALNITAIIIKRLHISQVVWNIFLITVLYTLIWSRVNIDSRSLYALQQSIYCTHWLHTLIAHIVDLRVWRKPVSLESA